MCAIMRMYVIMGRGSEYRDVCVCMDGGHSLSCPSPSPSPFPLPPSLPLPKYPACSTQGHPRANFWLRGSSTPPLPRALTPGGQPCIKPVHSPRVGCSLLHTSEYSDSHQLNQPTHPTSIIHLTSIAMSPGPLRTALKVDLEKPAHEQEYLHVRLVSKSRSIHSLTLFF